MTELCEWCKQPLKNFCVETETGHMHAWCKIAELNPDKTDQELWDIIEPDDSPWPVPKGKPWPYPRERVK